MGMAQDQALEESVPAGRAVPVVLDLLGKVSVPVPVVPAQEGRVPDQVQVGRDLPVQAQADRV